MMSQSNSCSVEALLYPCPKVSLPCPLISLYLSLSHTHTHTHTHTLTLTHVHSATTPPTARQKPLCLFSHLIHHTHTSHNRHQPDSRPALAQISPLGTTPKCYVQLTLIRSCITLSLLTNMCLYKCLHPSSHPAFFLVYNKLAC